MEARTAWVAISGILRFDDYRKPKLRLSVDRSYTVFFNFASYDHYDVECRVHSPTPTLILLLVQSLLGTIPGGVLADYLDEHRHGWACSTDQGDWATVLHFLRRWDFPEP